MTFWKRDIEYIEFRTCREGCPAGLLTTIDKYLAKSAVQKMSKLFGLGRRLTRENILRLYENGGKYHDSKRSYGTI
jgi:hypothetical protein